MFNCELCKTTIGPGVSPNLVVTHTRAVEYMGYKRNPETDEQTYGVLGYGYETVKEQLYCDPCADVPVVVATPRTFVAGKVFEEPVVAPFKQALVAITYDKAMDRTLHLTKRSKADIMAALPWFKQFSERNTRFKL